jgi:hypothetical protein
LHAGYAAQSPVGSESLAGVRKGNSRDASGTCEDVSDGISLGASDSIDPTSKPLRSVDRAPLGGSEGISEGTSDGTSLATPKSAPLEVLEAELGASEGISDGTSLATVNSSPLATELDSTVGTSDGMSLLIPEGTSEAGGVVGMSLEAVVAPVVGAAVVTTAVGTTVGAAVGTPVGATVVAGRASIPPVVGVLGITI